MSLREQILESMARALFVTAYADACDEYDSEDSANDPRHGSGSGWSKWTDAPRATAGADWMDVAPDAEEFDPQAAIDAKALAARMLNEFLKVNGTGQYPNGERALNTLYSLFNEWRAARVGNRGAEHDGKTFGHYIAMQSLGHGVGLNDDTGPGAREWKTGYFEGINL